MSDSPLSTPFHSESSSDDENHVRNTSFNNNLDSEPEGEDLLDNQAHDYQAIPQLDTYEVEGLDNEEYGAMSATDRLNAELEIRRRNRNNMAPNAFDWDDDDTMNFVSRRIRSHRGQENEIDPLKELFATDTDNPVVLQDLQGSPTEFVGRPEIRREIMRKFTDFLINFKNKDDESIYLSRIKHMAANNNISFEVSYVDLSETNPILGIWLVDAPAPILEIFDDAAFALVTAPTFFPDFARISPEIHVRISALPIVDNLRDLRQSHLNSLVRTVGVATKLSTVSPQFRIIKWRCSRCNSLLGPFPVTDEKPQPPVFCQVCNAKGGFKIDTAATIYRNYQKMTIQEPLSSVPPGRLPRTKEVILYGDLADCCRPGEEIEVTGIYKHQMEVRRQGFPVFSTVIEANYIYRSIDQSSVLSITDEEKRAIIELSHDPNLDSRIFQSIAPSIFGHDDIKAALAMALFGGRRKSVRDRHNVRGDINVLLLGDPGTAKSQFLKYAEKISPRAVFTNGKGASAVGLTASVHRDSQTKEWTLEGGALVLADGGVCLIDEFDKMSEKDRTSIHEAMEQQSISISKAGINTSLYARCSVIAACNPIHGRYESSLSFGQNAGLSEPILSRFDVLCVVKDEVDPIVDEQLANYVISSHMGGSELPGIDQELLKKYISYARSAVQPRLSDVDNKKIESLYNELRRESETSGGNKIAVRHLESIIRLSEAHARMHLRSNVIEPDINFAISVVLKSFVSTQKYANKRTLERTFSKYLVFGKDHNDLLFNVLQTIVRERTSFYRLRRSGIETEEHGLNIVIKKEDFERRARESGVLDYHQFYESKKFRNNFKATETEIMLLE
ncbi:DNA replication licensing factor Mcm2 [Tritrichomonas foetus]|uniref:DNA replication licensing factor MCM2 n=1 Tax=Tritrichomonas foetus TaxID=1144522 RepID=A0A1J4K9G8_9EUKA|nr:DNA replication licensing factor Mcm2 [Tritrichomonas foetus]|eukprot:OHT08113.1 DNA replication licensing factor Mcm2 [Tritrichomonas foetus]